MGASGYAGGRLRVACRSDRTPSRRRRCRGCRLAHRLRAGTRQKSFPAPPVTRPGLVGCRQVEQVPSRPHPPTHHAGRCVADPSPGRYRSEDACCEVTPNAKVFLVPQSGIRTNRLLCPHLPGARRSASVHNGDNQDHVGLEAEVDRKRESSKERTANDTVRIGIDQWRTAAAAERSSRLVEEFAAQTDPLFFVPACCDIEVILRFVSQNNTVGHSDARILSITAFASSPRSPSSSYARSRPSSSRL